MPTGYTCIIADHAETTFEQYAWRCARAFGALVMMRDDPLDAAPPEAFEPSDWHKKELDKATGRMLELRGMTRKQAAVLAAADYSSALKSWEERRDKEAEIDRRYDAIRTRVLAWEPPSSHHVQLKEFMLEQLETSRRHSGPGESPVKRTGDQWLAQQIKVAQWKIDYHTENHEKELARTEEGNRWLRELRASIPYVEQPK